MTKGFLEIELYSAVNEYIFTKDPYFILGWIETR